MLLTLQSVNFYYKYSNGAAEKATALPGILDSTTSTYHPLLGLGGQTSEQLSLCACGRSCAYRACVRKARQPMSELPQDLVKPPRLPSQDVNLQDESRSPPRSASPPRKEAEILDDMPAKDELADGVVVAEGSDVDALPPPPSEEQLLVKEVKEEMIKVRARQGRRKQEAGMREEWELKRMKSGLEAEMQKRLAPAKELLQHPTGDWIGVCRLLALETERTSSGLRWREIGAVHPKGGRKLVNSKLSEALMRTTGLKWAFAGAAEPTSTGRNLANSKLSDALMHKTNFTQQEWQAFGIAQARVDDYVKSGLHYFKPVSRKTEFTQQEWDSFGISDLRTDDYIKSGPSYFKPDGPVEKLGDGLKDVQTSALTEELTAEIALVQRQSKYLEAQDVFVEVMAVPEGNEGAIALPRGISIPGTYVLKYFTEASPVPLAVSDPFHVNFPKIGITAPAEVEIGRNFKLVSSPGRGQTYDLNSAFEDCVFA